MNQEDMKQRTRQFSLRVIRLVESLPGGQTAEILGRQLLRSGTSVGANYRTACRAKSTRDFISKMGTVEEETDVVLYWMELLSLAGIVKSEKLTPLRKEANELLVIIVASIKKRLQKREEPDCNCGMRIKESEIPNPKSQIKYGGRSL